MTTHRRTKARVRLLPYKQGSMSARELARAAGVLRLKVTDDSQFRQRPGDVIVNWGNHTYVNLEGVKYLNHQYAVSLARDKRAAFQQFTNAKVPTLEWTIDIAVAQRWYDEGNVVIQRNTATGQAAAGIVVCDSTLPGNVRPDGRGVLWTKYFKRKQEFRIHVWRNDVLDIQEKRKKRDAEADSRIRSHDNGWVFCREGVTCPEAVSLAAVAAVRSLGLDFGAVDVGWNEKGQRPAVFEVNTAPGLEGTTLEKYASKIKELVA